MKTYFYCLVLLVALFSLGCGKNAKVTGKVLFEDGTPLTKGTVIFDNGKEQAKGDLQSDGTYVLGFLNPNDGVPPGNYKVYITGATEGGKMGPMGNMIEYPKDLVEKKFTKADTSQLICDVKGTTTYDITVKRPKK